MAEPVECCQAVGVFVVVEVAAFCESSAEGVEALLLFEEDLDPLAFGEAPEV